MRWQTTAVVGLLLALLAGFYFYDVSYLSPGREKTEREKSRLWSVEPKDVEEVVIKRQQDTVRLERASDGWQMLEPVRATAARAAVDDLVANLTGARVDRIVAESPGALGEFGLDRPEADVTLRVKGRAERIGLSLGSKSPTGAWVYARKHGAPAVFVLSESLARDGTRPAGEYRDRTVITFERNDVTHVTLVMREDTIDLERAEPRRWRITRPVSLAADADVLTEFLDKLHAAQVKEFVAESPASLAPYGLDRPVRVELEIGKDKDRATRKLLLGRFDAAKKGVYAMRPGETSVLLLDEPVWTQLPKNVAALRDKTVVVFDRDRITRVDIESPKGLVTLVRAGDRWRLTTPEELPGDGPVIGGLLFQLRDMRALAFLPGVRFTPTVRVSLWERDAKAPKVVTVAPSPEKRGGQATAYAELAGQGPAVLVEGRMVADLSKSVVDLRDHMLFSGLEIKTVKRVRVKSGGRTALLERSGATGWRMLEPRRGAAKNGSIEDLLITVSVLRWDEIVSGDAKAHGLDAPSFEVTLFREDGAEVASLTVGKRDGTQVWVRTKGSAIYTVATSRLGTLPKVPDDFQG